MIKYMALALLSFGLGVGAANIYGAPEKSHSNHYAGQDNREISSLSEQDIKQLSNGQGWGFAKPAEFNGYPGPLHVMELKKELALTLDQQTAIEDAFASMKQSAEKLGNAFIEANRELDEIFITNQASVDAIKKKTLRTAELRAQLQRVHLMAHLQIKPLLTHEQKQKYSALRGYGNKSHSHGDH